MHCLRGKRKLEALCGRECGTTGSLVTGGDIGFGTSKGQHFNTQAANNDAVGTCTLASASPSTCTVTFTRAYTAAPVWVATNQTTQANPIKAAQTTTNVVFTGPNTVTDVVAYICMGNPN